MDTLYSRHEKLALTSRILLSAIFIISGLAKIFAWQDTLGYMTAAGIPAPPVFLVPAILIEVLGGLSILVGFKTRVAAAVVFVYLIPVTLAFHAFWNLDGAESMTQFANFMKNLAIMGGLSLLTAFGPGEVSVDGKLEERDRVLPDRGRHLRAA